jgi:hypothetical protein
MAEIENTPPSPTVSGVAGFASGDQRYKQQTKEAGKRMSMNALCSAPVDLHV